jgi:hypothetical protein
MKVLTTPTKNTILTFPVLGGTKFLGLDGKDYDEGIVMETNEATAKKHTQAAILRDNPRSGEVKVGQPFAFMTTADVMRDVRWIAKRLANVPNDTKVTMTNSAQGMGLDIPQDALPDYTRGLAVGVKIAVGPSISPKAMMNARGEVLAVNGTKVKVKLDASDIDRVNRATGKKFAAEVDIPKACIEVIA